MFQIARILKSNGTEGEILMGFRNIFPEDIEIQEPVFIYVDGLPVPFFIESLSIKGKDKAIVKFADIASLEDAEDLVGKDVFADSSSYEETESDDFSNLEGWTLLDENGGNAGIISGFEDIPGNPCLYVDTKNGQAMIPLHEDLVLSINENRQEIQMAIPDGLI